MDKSNLKLFYVGKKTQGIFTSSVNAYNLWIKLCVHQLMIRWRHQPCITSLCTFSSISPKNYICVYLGQSTYPYICVCVRFSILFYFAVKSQGKYCYLSVFYSRYKHVEIQLENEKLENKRKIIQNFCPHWRHYIFKNGKKIFIRL